VIPITGTLFLDLARARRYLVGLGVQALDGGSLETESVSARYAHGHGDSGGPNYRAASFTPARRANTSSIIPLRPIFRPVLGPV